MFGGYIIRRIMIECEFSRLRRLLHLFYCRSVRGIVRSIYEIQICFYFLGRLFFLVPLCGQEEPEDKLRAEAQNGNLESCFFLGNEYFYGENRKQNFTLAAHWFRKAAEGGIPEAQFNYAHCLETGRGTEKDLFSAYQWYRKAADRKFKPALYSCSRLLATGIFSKDGKVLLRPSQAGALEILEQLTAQEFEAAELDLAAYLLRRDSPLARKKRAHFQSLRK